MPSALVRPIQTLGRIWLRRWKDFVDRRRALRNGPVILQDAFDVRFILYPWDRPYLLELIRHPSELADFQAIPALVRSGDTAFDVGANVGQYSVLLSRICGPAGRVWAFEPVPETYWRLRETLVLNRCENVVPVQRAICAKVGTAKMNLFEPQFSGWNTLGMPSMITPDGGRVSPVHSVDVLSQTLDDFCEAEGIARVNFLKVDVEGLELAVFQGAERLLRERCVDYLCFEISKEPLKGAGIDSRQVFAALETHGYQAYRYDELTRTFQGPVRDSSEYWSNFYASWKDLSKIKENKESA